MNIPKLKPKECIVLYENFFEYGNFGEGNWSDEFQIFTSKKIAIDFIKNMNDNCNYRNIVGPLKQI